MSDIRIKSSFFLALFVSLYHLQIIHVSAINLLPEYEVTKAGGLPNNSSYLLRIHCQSKDDDLGNYDLHTSEQFSWHFTMNFWFTNKL